MLQPHNNNNHNLLFINHNLLPNNHNHISNLLSHSHYLLSPVQNNLLVSLHHNHLSHNVHNHNRHNRQTILLRHREKVKAYGLLPP